MCARERVLDLPCLGICLDCIQVTIVDCTSRNVRVMMSMQRVNVVLQDVTQSINPSVVNWNDGTNLALPIFTLEKIDYDAF